ENHLTELLNSRSVNHSFLFSVSTQLSFDRASEVCSPGVLATLATEQEVADVLRLVSRSLPPQNEFSFWVGLKKPKNKCVVPTLPLRGFRWTEDDSEESQVILWAKEPQDTCTTVRCAALQGRVHGSTVQRWGLVPVTCRNTSVHQFICKLRDRRMGPTSEDRVTPDTPAAPEPVTEPPGLQVECWSTVQLELHCRGRPAAWHLLDDSLANFTSVCQLCSDGFTKDVSANCVDIDECSGAPCRRTCVNTEGSFRCVCSDENGKQHDEGSAACSLTVTVDDAGVLVPVLVAVAVLVVLVVVVAVTVKCCLIRRTKRRAVKKKSEKMAMKDSFATANERTAT
uniref:Uncharacterized protein n=1 Tax=Scophthalmus maximus TaxID=52904 RepID=A0A8D3EE86_SCOMX